MSEFGNAVILLKKDIHAAVQQAVNAFEARTGATPCKIEVPIIENTNLRSEMKHYCVGDVTVTIGEF